MAQDGITTGIVDWDRDGFFCEYVEYTFAMPPVHSMEKWWVPVLKEII